MWVRIYGRIAIGARVNDALGSHGEIEVSILGWVVLSYCIGAVAFYRFIIATSEEDPGDARLQPLPVSDSALDGRRNRAA